MQVNADFRDYYNIPDTHENKVLEASDIGSGQVCREWKGDRRILMRLLDFRKEIENPSYVWFVNLATGEYGLLPATTKVLLLEGKAVFTPVATPIVETDTEWDDIAVDLELDGIEDAEDLELSYPQYLVEKKRLVAAKGGA